MGELRSVLVTGFVGLRYLTLRTGSAYSLFYGDEEDEELMRSDTAPLKEDMESRSVEFRLEI
jgi:hypothetical protein